METRTITKTITVYLFEELDEQAQNVVMKNTIDFLAEQYVFLIQEEEPIDNEDFLFFKGIEKAIKKAEEMRTPWFADEYIVEEIGEELKALMTEERWLFTEDGVFFSERTEEEAHEHQSA